MARLMNPRRLDLNLLVVFDAVVAEASVSRAASRLHLTQSALSHALGRLREAFGDPILVRQGRVMQATPRALAALPEVRSILSQAGRLFAEGGRFDPATLERSVHVGSSDYACVEVLSKVMPGVCRDAPGLRWMVRHAGRVDAPALLRAGSIDLALGVFGGLTPDLATEPLVEEPYLCAAWRGAWPTRTLTEAAYLEATHLNVLVAGDTLGLIDEALARRGVTRRIGATLAHFGAAVAMLSGGPMLLTAPAGLLRRAARLHDLRVMRVPVDLPPFRTQLAWARRRDDDECLTWLRQRIVSAMRAPSSARSASRND